MPLRYGDNISAGGSVQFSTARTPHHWAAYTESYGAGVRGAYALAWENGRPQVGLKELRLELTAEGSLAQVAVLGLTAYE